MKPAWTGVCRGNAHERPCRGVARQSLSTARRFLESRQVYLHLATNCDGGVIFFLLRACPWRAKVPLDDGRFSERNNPQAFIVIPPEARRWKLSKFVLSARLEHILARIFHSHLINTGLQPGESRPNEPRAASAASAPCQKPLKRLSWFSPAATGLKPGVNENRTSLCEISGLGWRGCRVVGDLHGLRLSDLMRWRNCGKATIRKLVRLVRNLQEGRWENWREANAAPPGDYYAIQRKFPANSWPNDFLVSALSTNQNQNTYEKTQHIGGGALHRRRVLVTRPNQLRLAPAGLRAILPMSGKAGRLLWLAQ